MLLVESFQKPLGICHVPDNLARVSRISGAAALPTWDDILLIAITFRGAFTGKASQLWRATSI